MFGYPVFSIYQLPGLLSMAASINLDWILHASPWGIGINAQRLHCASTPAQLCTWPFCQGFKIAVYICFSHRTHHPGQANRLCKAPIITCTISTQCPTLHHHQAPIQDYQTRGMSNQVSPTSDALHSMALCNFLGGRAHLSIVDPVDPSLLNDKAPPPRGIMNSRSAGGGLHLVLLSNVIRSLAPSSYSTKFRGRASSQQA